jgi:hypothetical protein
VNFIILGLVLVVHEKDDNDDDDGDSRLSVKQLLDVVVRKKTTKAKFTVCRSMALLVESNWVQRRRQIHMWTKKHRIGEEEEKGKRKRKIRAARFLSLTLTRHRDESLASYVAPFVRTPKFFEVVCLCFWQE